MKDINGGTKVFCIFGDPVQYSMSPVMHNAAFEHENLDCVYVGFNVKKENLKEAVYGIRGLGISGISITMPHKQDIMQYLDGLSDDARLIGAVNTIHNENGKLTGYNTDGPGFLRGLEEAGFKCQGKSALIFGAGGASRAIAVTLARNGIKHLYIVNRTLEKAEDIAALVKGNTKTSASIIEFVPERFNKVLPQVDLLINTTSQGMYGKVSELQDIIDWDVIDKKTVISDIVYRPEKTPLLFKAQQYNLTTVTGVNMLLYQAVMAYELWLNRKAPVNAMRKSLLEALAKSI